MIGHIPEAGVDIKASLREALQQSYSNARAAGFPMFPAGERLSTPLNAYPFHARLGDLHSDWAFSSSRTRLVEALEIFVTKSEATGVRAIGLLIGGSFADREIADPSDVDMVLYYTGTPHLKGRSLSALQRTAKSRLAIDCRFIPADADPMLTIRATIFFSLLYSKKEGCRTITRPPIYVDLC